MAKSINYTPARALGEYRILPGHIGLTSVDDVSLSAPITRYEKGEKPRITLHYSVVSSPMQAVYSPELNAELAKLGMFSISNWSQPVAEQAQKRSAVKSMKGGFVVPDVVGPSTLISELKKLTEKTGYNTYPVTSDGTLDTPMIGIITSNDYRTDFHAYEPVSARMIPIEKVVLGHYDEIGYDLARANMALIESHHGHLPVVDKDGKIVYVVFKKDVDEHLQNPYAMVDASKRYMGGDAVNTVDYEERVPALVEAGTDFLYVTTSQGDSDYVKRTLEWVACKFPSVPVGAGNVVTGEGFRFLADSGATCVGVGMGPGSICITQQQIGVGRAQGTAIEEVARARDEYFMKKGIYVPIIADGGISTPMHAIVAYALGADAIMGGRIFAGTDESPSDWNSDRSAKRYWGEGSKRAKEWGAVRYGHRISTFEEGVEGWVPRQGPVREHMRNFVYTVKDGMRKGGHMDIPNAHEHAVLEIISEAARAEGRPHDITL
ncbi:MAG: IMP dehydrogenase [Candidatus Aenigmarchaeota archaeon]|nr:IMP dehydrogenase [Candidatus Aenigmarchaeota archaeon]